MTVLNRFIAHTSNNHTPVQLVAAHTRFRTSASFETTAPGVNKRLLSRPKPMNDGLRILISFARLIMPVTAITSSFAEFISEIASPEESVRAQGESVRTSVQQHPESKGACQPKPCSRTTQLNMAMRAYSYSLKSCKGGIHAEVA